MIICKDQALFPFHPCNACKKSPLFQSIPGQKFYNVYKHWPVTAMEDFIRWVPAGKEIGKVATHTSFMDVNYSMRRSQNDFIPTPDPGTTWYSWSAQQDENSNGSELEALAHSYHRRRKLRFTGTKVNQIDLHRGRVLEEGYDFSLRAYTFRKTGEDRVNLTMKPRTAEINPVFLFNGWTSPDVQVQISGVPLEHDRYQVQINGHDLTVWVQGTFTEPTHFSFIA